MKNRKELIIKLEGQFNMSNTYKIAFLENETIKRVIQEKFSEPGHAFPA